MSWNLRRMPAGEGVEPVAQAVREAQSLDQRPAALARGGGIEVVERAVIFELLGERQVLVIAGVFGEQADAAADGGGLIGDGEAIDPGLARGGADQATEHPHGGRLAGAVGPEQAKIWPAGDGQGQVLDRDDGAGFATVGLAEGGGLDGEVGHGGRSVGCALAHGVTTCAEALPTLLRNRATYPTEHRRRWRGGLSSPSDRHQGRR